MNVAELLRPNVNFLLLALLISLRYSAMTYEEACGCQTRSFDLPLTSDGGTKQAVVSNILLPVLCGKSLWLF
jgi:hypothetical protein